MIKPAPKDDRADKFFSPALVRRADAQGLIALLRISPDRMLQACQAGVFPWSSVGDNASLFSWWSPDPRMIIMPTRFHRSRSLARRLRRGDFSFTVNRAFASVVRGCSRPGQDSWLNEEIASSYLVLHQRRQALSVEAWYRGQLAGGLLALVAGACLAGESMFSVQRDGSKACLAWICTRLASSCHAFIDCQVPSEHLYSLGGHTIGRDHYLSLLAQAASQPNPLLGN